MAAEYGWPAADQRSQLGSSANRVDGPVKATGAARYSRDVKRPGMLYAKLLSCPHAHARITRIDVSAAEAMDGVKAVKVIQGEGSEIQWSLDEVAAVAAISEEIARDAIRAIEVEYEVLPHHVDDSDLGAPETKPGEEETAGDADAALAAADVKSKGTYGLSMIAHCCLESHGQTAEWEGDQLTVWASTQAVSGVPGQIAEAIGVPAANVRCITPYMGGGFGSKFSPDRWGIVCSELSKQTGRPVKLFLERDQEQAVAGARPSYYAEIEIGATRDGDITGWASHSWGSGGPAGTNAPPLPYVWTFENQKTKHTSISTNVGPGRAWRAPRHPQACFLTMAAIEDLAAELKMDPLDLVLKNIAKTGDLAKVYEEELNKAAELIGWKSNWHPRGQSGSGPVKRGLGLALHTWGGRAHGSNCEVTIYPDGLAEARLGSQDLGSGTRTTIAIVLAESLGLGVEDVLVSLGDSRYPTSGASGGSTTVGGVSSSTRRAAVNALEKLFEEVAPYLDATPDQLEARGGKVGVKGGSGPSLTWKEAAAKLGVHPIVATGAQPGPSKLTDSGVGGVQMADVSVDVETGVARVNKVVAVQDCGLVVAKKMAESQVYGSVIMGIAYSLSEEKVFDPVTGRQLNPDMEYYKLPGIGDIGEIVVHMMGGPGYDERGVIGLGEPPVIGPGAALGNAVANAIGVRVPHLPMTPERILDALEKGGKA